MRVIDRLLPLMSLSGIIFACGLTDGKNAEKFFLKGALDHLRKTAESAAPVAGFGMRIGSFADGVRWLVTTMDTMVGTAVGVLLCGFAPLTHSPTP